MALYTKYKCVKVETHTHLSGGGGIWMEVHQNLKLNAHHTVLWQLWEINPNIEAMVLKGMLKRIPPYPALLSGSQYEDIGPNSPCYAVSAGVWAGVGRSDEDLPYIVTLLSKKYIYYGMPSKSLSSGESLLLVSTNHAKEPYQ
jgi:hypothetical protein